MILLLSCILIGWSSIAGNPAKAEQEARKLAAKYENTEGVESMAIVKGEGLELIKMMFKKEFGKKFMKGVTSIIIIEYTGASESVCASIRKDIDIFSSLLEEFDFLDKMEEAKNQDYIRFFAHTIATDRLSDFLIISEDKETKMMMYMGGEIIIE